ncbi:MAG TPA: SAM-dependent methyltransferase, partial [Acidimicrobiia bacterium]|nr:SAM-dependent methyltransferase [Acidimicrobiia bacterium]
MDKHAQINLASWESRVGIHVKSQAYDVDALVAGTRRLSDVVAFDEPYLGDLTGLDVVHLQCHIGTDTLSLARLGARTVT